MSSGMGHDLALELALALEHSGRRVAPEVEDLVALAQDLGNLPDPEIDPRFATRLEARLMAEGLDEAHARHLHAVEPLRQPDAPEAPASPSPVIPLPRRRVVLRRGMVAAVAAAMLLVFPVTASASALPGGLFHSFKINVIERIELALAGGDIDKGFKHLELAQRRIDEIAQLLALGAEGPVPGAIRLMQAEQLAGATRIGSATSNAVVLGDAAGVLQMQAGALTTLASDLSDGVRPAALDAAAAAQALAAGLTGTSPAPIAPSADPLDVSGVPVVGTTDAAGTTVRATGDPAKSSKQPVGGIGTPRTPRTPTDPGGGHSEPSRACLGEALGLPLICIES